VVEIDGYLDNGHDGITAIYIEARGDFSNTLSIDTRLYHIRRKDVEREIYWSMKRIVGELLEYQRAQRMGLSEIAK